MKIGYTNGIESTCKIKDIKNNQSFGLKNNSWGVR